jgi:hypothetical protein
VLIFKECKSWGHYSWPTLSEIGNLEYFQPSEFEHQ